MFVVNDFGRARFLVARLHPGAWGSFLKSSTAPAACDGMARNPPRANESQTAPEFRKQSRWYKINFGGF